MTEKEKQQNQKKIDKMSYFCFNIVMDFVMSKERGVALGIGTGPLFLLMVNAQW